MYRYSILTFYGILYKRNVEIIFKFQVNNNIHSSPSEQVVTMIRIINCVLFTVFFTIFNCVL